MANSKTLKQAVEENKAFYLKKYGELNWQWYDEGVVNAMLDYLSSYEPTQEDYDYAMAEAEIDLDELMRE